MTQPKPLLPSLEYLRTRVRYEPESGHFHWIKPPKGPQKYGDLAGHVGERGYIFLMACRSVYRAHRLAWLFMTGEEPPPNIDHADGDVANNRWTNLRAATDSSNNANKRLTKQNSSGYKGVCFDKFTGRWTAHLRKNGKLHNLGRFDTPEEAYAAYCAAAPKFHGEFARTA